MGAGGIAVVNADSDHAAVVVDACRGRGHTVVLYGRAANDAGVRLDDVAPESDGLTMAFTLRGGARKVRLPLAGTFQAMNALCALALIVFCDGDDDAAVAALEDLEGAPGRLQLVVRLANGASVYVDYAHTPDALETVLRALRPHTGRRLVAIVGCGGDRDPGKRPMMGEIAAREADVAYVTDDNPRSEAPAAIRAAILAACPGGIEIGDRAEAIDTAMRALGPGDILVIAGKGHELGQTVGDVVHPFDDAAVARDVASHLGAAA
jgi:UDP-N-acetylmuramoyl-L-alanyl-D-glutamate--2,6-diaminopimelate ligase